MSLIEKIIRIFRRVHFRDPIYHGWESDGLPKFHPDRNEEVFCCTCGKMVHAFNNECMCPWFEIVVDRADRAVCVDCLCDSSAGSLTDLVRRATPESAMEKYKRNVEDELSHKNWYTETYMKKLNTYRSKTVDILASRRKETTVF